MLHLVCWPARTGRVLSALIVVISSLSAQTALASLPTAPGGSSAAQPQAPEEARRPALARIETETGPQGTTRRTYDSAGRLTRASYPNGQVIDYGYDAAGRKTTLTTAGRITNYGYDELNRLISVTDHTGTTRHAYDALGRQTEVRYPNGTVTTTEYDRLSRPILVETRDASGNIIARSAYTLDKAGHRTQVVELDTATCAGAVPCTATRTVDYVYDPLYRLVSETVTDASGTKSTTWTYDRVGNRLREDANGVITAYTYDKNDRLLTETRNGLTTTYTYDKNGNTTSKVGPEGSVTYTWNQDNRLIAASDGSQNLTFSYDASGIRQSRTVNGVTTEFLVDPNQPYAQVLAEYQGGAEQVFYAYGDDLLSQTRAGGASYYHYDALGSTRALTDAAGSLTDAYAYKSFGEIAAQRGATPNAYLFAGEQFDQGLKQYYLRDRYFDQRVGRFSQLDRFVGRNSEPGSLHKYAYAQCNPIAYTDHSGRDVGLMGQMFAIGAIGVLAGVAISNSNILSTTTWNDDDDPRGIRPSTLGWLVLAAMAAPGTHLLDRIGGGGGGDNGGTFVLYHGTSVSAGIYLANGGVIDAEAMTCNWNASCGGFYLADEHDDAEHFAVVTQGGFRDGVVVKYEFTRKAYTTIMGLSTKRPIPPARRFNPVGNEIVVPQSAFPVFNGLLAKKEIVPSTGK